MLLAAVPVCYLLFFRSQPAGNAPTPEAHSQYKRDMDQARDAARQMQAQKAEADSIP